MNVKSLSFTYLLLFACALSFYGAGPPLIVAHRGGAGDGLENSLSCIERSICAGVDAVEDDVRLTADGHIVVFHDAAVNRLTDGRGRVEELTLQQMRTLRLTDAAGVATNETVPTLREVLSLVDGRCGVLVDVKEGGRGIEERLIEDITACGAEGWTSVHAFDDDVLSRLHELAAPFPLEKLIVFKLPLLPVVYDGSLRCFSFEKYSYISSFNFHRNCLPRSLAAKIKAHGKDMKVWTLRSPADAPRAAVDAVITDNPSLWFE